MFPLFVYLIFGILLILTSALLLFTVLYQKRLREKYSVFSVKFGVDLVTSSCLIALGCLDRSDEGKCGAILVLSTSIPLLQALLLLSEVVDWWLAAFSPVYFHNSSLISRIIPFLIGTTFCVIIISALIAIDLTTDTSFCLSSPASTAIVSSYDLALAITTICLVMLMLMLRKNLNSTFFRPIIFHFLATVFLQQIPLLVVISLKYTDHPGVVPAADVTNVLVAVHALLHSAYFVYNHEDVRQGFRSTFLRCPQFKST